MRAGSRPRTDGPPQPERSAVTRRSAAAESSRRGPTEAEALAAAKFAYNPALDGLRVVCIYIILAGHMGAIRASNVAVDMFCVLSGFLITTLLLAEQARTGTIAIGKFLVRRSFRLMPGMWFYLLVGLAVTVAFKWDDIPYRDDFFKTAISTFFNVNNWYRIVNPEAGGRWLPHVWSLSMEEQFYLIWPGGVPALHALAPTAAVSADVPGRLGRARAGLDVCLRRQRGGPHPRLLRPGHAHRAAAHRLHGRDLAGQPPAGPGRAGR